MKLVTPVIAIICSMTMFAMPLQAKEGMSWYMGGIMGLTSTDVTEFDNTDVENQVIFPTKLLISAPPYTLKPKPESSVLASRTLTVPLVITSLVRNIT